MIYLCIRIPRVLQYPSELLNIFQILNEPNLDFGDFERFCGATALPVACKCVYYFSKVFLDHLECFWWRCGPETIKNLPNPMKIPPNPLWRPIRAKPVPKRAKSGFGDSWRYAPPRITAELFCRFLIPFLVNLNKFRNLFFIKNNFSWSGSVMWLRKLMGVATKTPAHNGSLHRISLIFHIFHQHREAITRLADLFWEMWLVQH